MKADSTALRRFFLKTSVLAAAAMVGLLAAAPSLPAGDQEPRIEGKTIGQLIAKLRDKDPDVRSAAAAILDRIGPEAKAAVPALTDALKDKTRMCAVPPPMPWGELARRRRGPCLP